MEPTRRLKTWVALVGFVGLSSGLAIGAALPSAVAAAFPDVHDYPDVPMLRERYGLTAEQTRLVLLVFRDRDQQMLRAVRSAPTLPEELERELMRIYRHTDDRIEAVLDAAQRAKYRKVLDEQPKSASPTRRDRAKNR